MSNEEIPAAITTAHLLLRGLVPAFLGCSIGDDDEKKGNDGSGFSSKGVRASAFQMTYRKDLPKLGVMNGELLYQLECLKKNIVLLFAINAIHQGV